MSTPNERSLLYGNHGLTGALFSVPIITIPSLSSAQPLFDNNTDSTWHAVSSTIWFQISLGLSIVTACIPSLKGVIDSLMGATAAAMIQGPYELRAGTDKSGGGFTATRATNSKQNSYARSGASSGAGRRGPGASKRKSTTPLATWGDVEHQTTIRNESPDRSESVRKLTDGVIVVRDEVEVLYDDKTRRTSRGNDSRDSSEGGYRM